MISLKNANAKIRMDIDFAVIYWGLTRSTKKVYQSHRTFVYDVLKQHNLTHKVFIHTWRTKDNKQKIWENTIPQEIDYDEYNLLNPDFYKIDAQWEFLDNLNMNNYFYKDIWETTGHDPNYEWLPGLIQNHLCALESMKRGLEMVENQMCQGYTFKYIMFIRPDVQIHNSLPIQQILLHPEKISIPNNDHYEGYNDRFAIMNYSNSILYGKRINEIAEFRKNNGRIVSEKYIKFIINKYNIPINFISFNFTIVRP